jgi:PGF-CTERM protein
VDVVLAIDGSASLEKQGNESTDPKRLRVDAAQQFLDGLNRASGDRIGVVHWNDTIVGKPLDLTSDFGNAKAYLNKSDSNGDTNIELALNSSWNLLQRANPMNPASKKVIIVFTDGKDTKSTPAAIKETADKIKESGIEIYPLSLGNSDDQTLQLLGTPIYAANADELAKKFNEITSKIFASVEDVEVKYAIPRDLEFYGESEVVDRPSSINGNIMTWRISSMNTGDFKNLTFKLKSNVAGAYNLAEAPNSLISYKRVDETSTSTATMPIDNLRVIEPAKFYYVGYGNGSSNEGILDPEHKVTVTKDIVSPANKSNWCQDIVICVKTPKVDFKPVAVFALDSSGSAKQIRYSDPMLQGIGNSVARHRSMEYARVDWDTNDTSNVDPATGISPAPRDSGIDYSGEFRKGSTWLDESRMLLRLRDWRAISPFTEPLSSFEEEGTTYYQGLKEALDKIIDQKRNSSNFVNHTTAWQVVFVAGKSEYISSEALDRLADYARENEINISVIGIDISLADVTTQNEAKDLRKMASYPASHPYELNLGVPADARTIEAITDNILDSHVRDLESTPIIKNIEVNETIYRYLKVVDSYPRWNRKTPNPDGTTTLYYRLGNLTQDNTSCIFINTTLNFDNLPIDVGVRRQNRSEVDFRALNTTPISMVTYETDLVKGNPKPILLPEGSLSIRCGEPCSSSVSTVPISKVDTNNNTSSTVDRRTTSPSSVPGFEVLATILGLVAVAFAARRNRGGR